MSAQNERQTAAELIADLRRRVETEAAGRAAEATERQTLTAALIEATKPQPIDPNAGRGLGDGSGPGNQTDQPPKNPAARIKRQRTARQFQPFPSQWSRPTVAIRCARKPALLGEVERASQGRFSPPWCLPVGSSRVLGC